MKKSHVSLNLELGRHIYHGHGLWVHSCFCCHNSCMASSGGMLLSPGSVSQSKGERILSAIVFRASKGFWLSWSRRRRTIVSLVRLIEDLRRVGFITFGCGGGVGGTASTSFSSSSSRQIGATCLLIDTLPNDNLGCPPLALLCFSEVTELLIIVF